MISRPCRSSARARASTSKADSVPSRLIDGANLMSAFSSCDVVAGIIRDGRHHRRSLTPGAIADISTAMKRLVFVAALVLVTGTAEAQLGNVNPVALPPNSTAQPFGKDPHPFNNVPGWAPVMRVFDVSARTAWLPVEVVQPGSLSPIVEYRRVTPPGRRRSCITTLALCHRRWGR